MDYNEPVVREIGNIIRQADEGLTRLTGAENKFKQQHYEEFRDLREELLQIKTNAHEKLENIAEASPDQLDGMRSDAEKYAKEYLNKVRYGLDRFE